VPSTSVSKIPLSMAISIATASGGVPGRPRKDTCVAVVSFSMNTMKAAPTAKARRSP
jgi:hypothetical protein